MASPEDLASQVADLSKQLKATDDKLKDKEMEKARLSAITASIKLAMEHMSPNERSSYKAKAMAGSDEDLKAAFSTIPDESIYHGPTPNESSNRSSIEGDGKVLKSAEEEKDKKEKEQMEARIKELVATVAGYQKSEHQKFVDQLAAHKTQIVKTLDINAYRTVLGAKTLPELKAMFEERKDEMQLSASVQPSPSSTGTSFPYDPPTAGNEMVSLATLTGSAS